MSPVFKMTTILSAEVSMASAYSIIIAVFPYTDTIYVYNQLRRIIPIPWTGVPSPISLERLLDVFAQIVPQKAMSTFLPRLVQQLTVIVRIGPFDEVERLATLATLRIRIPPDREDTDDEDDCDRHTIPVCYCR